MRKATLTIALLSGLVAGATAQAQPYGYGPGMMGWGGGYGPGWMMGPGYSDGHGPGWMMRGGYGMGPGMMYGYAYSNEGNLNLTVDQVKQYLAQMIRNPNLKVGDVKEKDGDTIVAEVVTKQGNGLVQKLDFNRHTGFVQAEQ
ncbi:MAG TPA: hypothetical protein VFL51_03310 [Pseudolabrys sp.]|nr:hypothetical protein [Pseudolabrys sp.]